MRWLSVRVTLSAPLIKTQKRLVFIIKPITRKEINILIENGIIHNSYNGIVDSKNNPVGYYAAKTKVYIEDKYVDIARKIKD